jgi:hypothetical protein
MSERGPVFQRLTALKKESHEFFFGFRTALKGMPLAEIDSPSAEQKKYLQDSTMRIVYACLDVLTALNPGKKISLKIEPAYDLNYESLGRTGEEAA